MSTKNIFLLKPRDKRAHKGDFGSLLIIGGQLGMAGAPALAGLAALRSGAGKVTVAVPQSIVHTVASFHPSLMTMPFGEINETRFDETHTERLLAIAKEYDVIVLGPGLGRSPATAKFVRILYAQVDKPMIVDADALFALSQEPHVLDSPPQLRILTPHAGEFARLTKQKEYESHSDRSHAALDFCSKDASHQTYLVLKGHKTVVANHETFFLNTTGNPGMATAGTGDCLAGMIAAQCAVEKNIFLAIRRAVYVHGLAGDFAAKTLGEIGMVATDLIDALPKAWLKITKQ